MSTSYFFLNRKKNVSIYTGHIMIAKQMPIAYILIDHCFGQFEQIVYKCVSITFLLFMQNSPWTFVCGLNVQIHDNMKHVYQQMMYIAYYRTQIVNRMAQDLLLLNTDICKRNYRRKKHKFRNSRTLYIWPTKATTPR